MALTDIEAGRLADNVFNVVGANKNLIINGAMQVAQRGSTGVTTSGYGTVDRFSSQWSSGSVTQTQETLSSGAPYDQGFRYFYRQTNSTAASATDSGERKIRHYIEAQNVAGSGWNYTSTSSYITLSFWIRSSVAQEFYGYLRSNDGTNQAYGFSTGSLTANTWTKVTKTVPGNSNLEFANDNGAGLELNIAAFFGTNYTDSGYTLDAWAAYSNSSRSPVYTSAWATTASATFDVTGVQLEVGSVATPFEHRPYGDELARCQRYYYKAQTTRDNQSGFFGTSYNRTTTSSLGVTFFPVQLRTAPTALEQSGTASDYQVAHGTGGTTCTSVPAWFDADTFSARTSFTTGVSLTAGEGATLRSASTDAFLAWSAEL